MEIKTSAWIYAIAIIVAAFLLGNAYKFKYKKQESINVTGLAEQDFTSDLIVWRGSYTRKSPDMKTAYAQLKEDESKIKQYLQEKSIESKEAVFSSVRIIKDYENYRDDNGNYYNRFNGFLLSQDVKIESKDIAKVESISRDITRLIDMGVELNSEEPQYYYTKLRELKIKLLSEAASDARSRAESIAKNSKSNLGNLLTSNMGIFQITGQNSNEDYSYGGAFNTTSKNKTASITVKAQYAIK
jgi:hypothetical protein